MEKQKTYNLDELFKSPSSKGLYLFQKYIAERNSDEAYEREAKEIKRSMAEAQDVSAVEKIACNKNCSPRMTRLSEIGSLKFRI